MKIRLENVGLIGSSEIEIDGITVIAGENATGKSTVGKALYCIFNSLHNIQNQVEEIRYDNIDRILSKYSGDLVKKIIFDDEIHERYRSVVFHIIRNRSDFISDKKALNNYIKEILNLLSEDEKEETTPSVSDADMPYYPSNRADDDIQSITNQVFASLNIPKEEIVNRIIQINLDAEFNREIANRYRNEERSEISLIIKNDVVRVEILNNDVSNVENITTMGKGVVYIDDPYVIDDLNFGVRKRWLYRWSIRTNAHRESLREKLLRKDGDILENIKTDKKLKEIYKNLENMKIGNLVYENRSYRCEINEVSFDFRNIAVGLKLFIIIKTLLENGSLETNGTMILDEPEIHLHPKWQLLLAELIVLIQREFNMHILLNTHSPYFLNAIEVYSKHHGVSERCRYYLMELSEENIAHAKDVTENTEEIYKLLAQPFDTLEMM